MRILLFLFVISFLPCGGQSLFHNLLTNRLDSDYQAYLTYISGTLSQPLPSQGVQSAQNKFVTDMKSAGLWSRLKTGYFFHAGSLAGACRVNIKDPSTYLLTVSGSPFFFEGMGTRSSLNGYFNQPFKSDEYSGIQTDLTSVQGISNYEEYDVIAQANFSQGMRMNAAGTSVFATYPKYDASLGYFYHGTASVSFANTDQHEGIYTLTYNGTQSVMYRNGAKTTATNTPIAPGISINRFILSYNNATVNGGTTPSTFYDRYVWGDFLFDRFTDADELAFRTILTNYKNSLDIGYGFSLEQSSYCWFASPMSVYHSGSNKSWFGQVHRAPADAGYTQYIFQRDHTTGVLSGFKLGTVNQQDDHNEPGILIRSSDSKLIAVYSEHSGTLIRWRISTNATDGTAWGAQSTIDPSAGVRLYTYPSIFQVSNGDIYIFYRGNRVDGTLLPYWYFIKSTDGGATFGAETEFWHNTYVNIYQDPNDSDILQFVASINPSDAPAPYNSAPFVGSFYFDGGANTWHKTDGTSAGALPLENADVTQLLSETLPEDVWFEDIIVDSNGYPRVLMVYYPDYTTTPEIKHRYYTEWNGSAWSTPYDMGQVMSKSISSGGSPTLLVEIYTGGANFDPDNPDIFYGSFQVGSRMEMFKYQRISASSFSSTQITFNSAYDQWRPFVTKAPNRNLSWLGLISYQNYLIYNQVLVIKNK